MQKALKYSKVIFPSINDSQKVLSPNSGTDFGTNIATFLGRLKVIIV